MGYLLFVDLLVLLFQGDRSRKNEICLFFKCERSQCLLFLYYSVCVCVCVCACVCLCVRACMRACVRMSVGRRKKEKE